MASRPTRANEGLRVPPPTHLAAGDGVLAQQPLVAAGAGARAVAVLAAHVPARGLRPAGRGGGRRAVVARCGAVPQQGRGQWA